MNTKQYIPALVNPFDCDYYGKEFPYNQHMGEHRFIQSEGKSFSEYRHSQAVEMNSEQFVTYEANSYPSGVYGVNFPQNQLMNERRFVHSSVLSLDEQRNPQAINMTTEPYTSGEANHPASHVNRTNYTQQQHLPEHNLVHDGILPIGSENCDSSRLARKRKHDSERTFICEVCGRGFFEMSSLTIHSRIHSGDRPFPCEVCGKKFASREGLRSHLVVHSEEKRFACDLCDKKFARKQQLQHHRLIHTGERPHVCEVCQKGFPMKKRLKIHMLVHTEERPYPCDQCDKRFKSKGEVKKHSRHHSKEKGFLCELCPMSFYSRTNLKLHQRVHTGVKPYHCQVCPMKYSNKSSFLNHVRSHDEQNDAQTLGINPDATPVQKNPGNLRRCTTKSREHYMCHTCREEFTEQSELEEHRLHHKREKPFSCFICRVRFFRSPNLKLHLNIVHSSGFPHVDSQAKSLGKSELFPCEMCDKSFPSRIHLKCHIRCHLRPHNSSGKKLQKKHGQFACGKCGKRYILMKNLRDHVLIHCIIRKGTHKCVVCSKRFTNRRSLIKHIPIHSAEQPYVCPVCHDQYRTKGSLRTHMVIKHYEQRFLQMLETSSEQHASDEENISLATLRERILKEKYKHLMNKDD